MTKQQMKIVDMRESLLKEGYQIGYTTVRNYVNEITTKQSEVFIRKSPDPGTKIEFDWGEVKLEINNKIKSYSLGVFTFPYSNHIFSRIYESESQICVLEVHTKVTSHWGFTPKVFTYDNMRTVVQSSIGKEKVIHEKIKNLAQYYHFDIRLCNARKGNEKGSVERSVEYIRRKAFSNKYTLENLDEANGYLMTVLKGLNERMHHELSIPKTDLMREEKAANGVNIIQPFDTSDLVECRVDKYSIIVVNQNHYSVPEGHVGKYIRVKVGAEEIHCFIDGVYVCSHSRNWGVRQWVMDINHYLETFKKKSGALSQSQCLKQAPKEIKNTYKTHYIEKEKEFLALLQYIKKKII